MFCEEDPIEKYKKKRKEKDTATPEKSDAFRVFARPNSNPKLSRWNHSLQFQETLSLKDEGEEFGKFLNKSRLLVETEKQKAWININVQTK